MAMDLGKQVGPLPLGAWFVVVAAGLGIALYTRRQNASPVEVEDQSGVPGVGTGEVGGWVPTQPNTTGNVEGSITTNEQWGQRAARELLARGTYNPTMVDQAIRNYLAGLPLSVTESAMIAIALAVLGPPPQLLPPVENPPPPTGGGGTAVPATPNVRVTGNTTVRGVSSVQLDWDAVTNANRYELQRVAPTVGTIVATDGSEFLFNNLKPRVAYSFQIRAIGPGGRSGWKRVSVVTKG